MSQVQIGSWLYHQIQINGERITTNLSFKTCLLLELNPREVFVSGIPYNMYEDNLIPLFEIIGVVAKFRLMMDYSGKNRGYGYVIFVDSNDANRAIVYLNNIQVSSWCKLKLSVSQNARYLWLGNTSCEFDVPDVVDMILERVDPAEISTFYRNGLQYFLIKFDSHRDAALSRKLLLREISNFGPRAFVNWELHTYFLK